MAEPYDPSLAGMIALSNGRPASSARGRSTRRRRIDLSGTMELMNAMSPFEPVPEADARRGLDMAEAISLPQIRAGEDKSLERRRRNAEQIGAMDTPISIESGSPIEAAAEVLTAILRGKAAGREFDEQEDERTREEMRKENERSAIRRAIAITGDDPAEVARQRAEIVGEYLPEQAFDITQGLTMSDLERRGRRDDAEWEVDTLGPRKADLDLYGRGYRRGENGGFERFGPAADEHSLNWFNAQTSRMNAARAGRGASALSPRDEQDLSGARDAARAARDIDGLLSEFETLGRTEWTGAGSGILTLGSAFSPKRQRMEAINNALVPRLNALVRLPGAASERDAERLTRSAPNVDASREANQQTIDAMRQANRNVRDYSIFAEQFARGNEDGLLGAEETWDAYLELNPIYDQHGATRTDRPSFSQWMALPQDKKDMREARAPASAVLGVTDQDIANDPRIQQELRGPGTVQRRSRRPGTVPRDPADEAFRNRF